MKLYRSEIYNYAKKISKGNIFKIIVALILLSIIATAFEKILNVALPTISEFKLTRGTVAIDLGDNIISRYFSIIYEKPYSYYIIKKFLQDILSFLFSFSISLSVLQFVRERKTNFNAKFELGNIFLNLREYFKELLLIATMISVISVILSLVPFVGPFISIIFSLLTVFVVFLIPENRGGSPFAIFAKSIKKARGHLLDIVLIYCKYIIVPVIILIAIVYLLAYTFYNSSYPGIIAIMEIIVLVGTIVLLYKSAMLNLSLAIFYESLDNNINFVDERIFDSREESNNEI